MRVACLSDEPGVPWHRTPCATSYPPPGDIEVQGMKTEDGPGHAAG
jgi:hypothetical protein